MGTEPHQREALASVGTYWMLVDVLEESNASELGKKDPQRLSLCSTLDIYISDPCFGGATIQNMAVSYQKGGQMGSRCIYIYINTSGTTVIKPTNSFHITPDPVDPVMSLLLRPSFLFWAKPLDAPATRRQLSKWSLRQGDKGTIGR